jgi:hypothetical protein
MLLPIKINNDGKIYDSIEIKRPSSGVLADTLNIYQTQNKYSALLHYLTGIATLISGNNDVTDSIQIKSLLRKMPYKSAEYISVISASQLHNNESIEGIYDCPRCNKGRVVCEETDDYDNTDKLSDLKVVCTDDFGFKIDADYPFELKTTNGDIEIKSVEMNYPTLENCINASQNQDVTRLQFRIYAEALIKVNGEEVEKKERSRYGMQIFNRMDPSDLSKIGKANRDVGLQTVLKKTCPDCNKKFDAIINPSNFLGLALQED